MLAPKIFQNHVSEASGAIPGGSGEVPGSFSEALGDCGRLQESPEGSREAPGASGEVL